MDLVHPDVINKIYKLLIKSKNPPSKKELIRKFSPSSKVISLYKDKILIRMFYVFDNTTTFSSNELLDIKDFRKISWDEKIPFGSVNGDTSDITFCLDEIIVGAIEDPYIIYKFIENYKEIVLLDGGYLHKYILEKKEESEFSEEISEEESE
jgi:hypothetical protein